MSILVSSTHITRNNNNFIVSEKNFESHNWGKNVEIQETISNENSIWRDHHAKNWDAWVSKSTIPLR